MQLENAWLIIMILTLKKLLYELEKIENKYLEIEVKYNNNPMLYYIDSVEKIDKKIVMHIKDDEV